MGSVTDMNEFRERKGRANGQGGDFLTDLLTDPLKRRKVAWVAGGAALAGILVGAMSQDVTSVISMTSGEAQHGQILSVTAENQLAQAIAEAESKKVAPNDQLEALTNGSNVVAVQKGIVDEHGNAFANPSAVDVNTVQYEPGVGITNTVPRYQQLFAPDQIGKLGITVTPVGQNAGR